MKFKSKINDTMMIEKNFNPCQNEKGLFEYSETIIEKGFNPRTIELSGLSNKMINLEDLLSSKSLFKKGEYSPDIRITKRVDTLTTKERDFDDVLIVKNRQVETIYNTSSEVPNGVQTSKNITEKIDKIDNFDNILHEENVTKIKYYNNGLPSEIESYLKKENNGTLSGYSKTRYEELPDEDYRFEDTKADMIMLENHILPSEETRIELNAKDKKENIDVNLTYLDKTNGIESEKRITKNNVTEVEKTNEITGETTIQKYEDDELVDEEKITVGSSMVDEYENSYDNDDEYKNVC